ncbi:hypothetical protein [Psychroserpens sp. S379A]|uniref:hypothetical protein n=1 Tax=Psychroserpens sp. S379A TaxID=3415137 RepID=UPI003C7D05E2
MKTTTTNHLSCSIFGHNLERVSKDSHEMICKTCKAKVSMDASTSFDALPFENTEIMSTLQQLYLLKNRFYKRQLSV